MCADDIVDLDPLRLQRLPPCECQQASGQVCPTQRRFQRIPYQFIGHRIIGPHLAQHVKIADDDSQQIVEVVREAAGKLAYGFHLLRLAQLLALPFGFVSFSEITDYAHECMIAGSRRRADGQLHREGRSVLATPHHFPPDADDLRDTRLEVSRDVAVVLAVVGLRHQDLDVLADDLIRRVAEQADTGLVERLDDTVAIDCNQAVDDGVQHRFDQAAQPGFINLRDGFRRSLRGDVADDRAESLQAAVGGSDGRHDCHGAEARSILPDLVANLLEAANRRSGLQRPLGLPSFGICRRKQARIVSAGDLIGLPARDDLSTTIPREDAAVRVEQQNCTLFHSRHELDLQTFQLGRRDDGERTGRHYALGFALAKPATDHLMGKDR